MQAAGNKTFLTPTNDAFANVDNISTNALTASPPYHVLNGTVRFADIPDSGHYIANSFFNNNRYVRLPNNATQVVVLQRNSENNVSVAEATRNASFTSPQDGPTYENLLIQPINAVLTIPGNLSSVVTELNATELATALTQADLLDALVSSRDGLTIFAPTNAAFDAASSAISAASPDQRANVLATHVIK